MRALPGWTIIMPEEKTKEGGLYLPDSAKTEMLRGLVFDVAFKPEKEGSPSLALFAKGDRVVYKKYYDNDLEVDGKKYKVVPVDQVMVILNED